MYDQNFEDDQPVKLRICDEDDDESGPESRQESLTGSKAGSAYSKSAKSVLGFSPMDMDKLRGCTEMIKRWMNFHVLST